MSDTSDMQLLVRRMNALVHAIEAFEHKKKQTDPRYSIYRPDLTVRLSAMKLLLDINVAVTTIEQKTEPALTIHGSSFNITKYTIQLTKHENIGG